MRNLLERLNHVAEGLIKVKKKAMGGHWVEILGQLRTRLKRDLGKVFEKFSPEASEQTMQRLISVGLYAAEDAVSEGKPQRAARAMLAAIAREVQNTYIYIGGREGEIGAVMKAIKGIKSEDLDRLVSEWVKILQDQYGRRSESMGEANEEPGEFKMTPAQLETIKRKGGDPSKFYPGFGLPKGWVSGWLRKGEPGAIYIGIDPDGEVSS